MGVVEVERIKEEEAVEVSNKAERVVRVGPLMVGPTL